MGNVLTRASAASTGSSFTPPSAAPPPPPPTLSSTESSSDGSNQSEEKLIDDSGLYSPNFLGYLVKNPGTVEDLHRKCRDIFPTPFEGARVIVNKGLSNHFQISHTLNMSSITPSGYRFGTTYVGSNVVGPGEAYPVFLGDIDPNGNLNANCIFQLHPKVKTKLVAQIQESRCVGTQLSSDLKNLTGVGTLTLANIDLINSSGVVVGQYLQAITNKIDAGVEIAYQYGPKVPGGGVAALSLAGRYSSPNNFIVSGSISEMGAHICYYHKAKEQLQVGVEIETNLRMGESTATFGYQIDLPKADLVFRGSVDSNWQVGAVLEKKLQPMPFTLLLSGHINHSRNSSYRFGVGLLLG